MAKKDQSNLGNGMNYNEKLNTSPEETGDNEKTQNDSYLKKTSEDLFFSLAEDFNSFLTKNIDQFVGLSLQDVFLRYLANLEKEKKSLLNFLEEKLGRQITFEDIKDLYLTTGHTLFENITQNFFERIKNVEIAKNILKQFASKIQQKVSEMGININIIKPVDEILAEEENISVLIRKIRAKLLDILKNLSEEEKEKLKQVKLYNYEIIENLFKDNLLTKEEYDFLKGKITNLSNDIKSKIDLNKILNLQNSLLTANFLERLSDINSKFNEIKLDFNSLFEGFPLWKIINLKKPIENINIVDILKNNKDFWGFLSEEEKKKFEQCLTTKNPSHCLLKKILELSEDKKRQILKKIYINSLEFDNQISAVKKDIVMILERVFDKGTLTQEDINLLKKLLYPLYKKKIMDVFGALNIHLNKKVLEHYIDFIFNQSNGKLTINGIDFDANAYFDFPVNLENAGLDILNGKLIVKLVLTGDNIDLLSNLFPEYFVDYKDKSISKFSKVKVKTKDGKIVEGYLDFDVSKNQYEIYSQPGGSINPTNNSPINTFSSEEIENIEILNNKLELNGWADITKLAFNLDFIENIKPLKGIKEKTLSDKKNKRLTPIEKKVKLNKFNRVWQDLCGDKNVKFQKGAILTVKGKVIQKLPGIRKNWYHLEIVDIDSENLTWTIMPYGGVLKLEGENKEFTLPLDADILEDIKFSYNESVYKFKKSDNLEQFYKNINGDFNFDSKQYEEVLTKWKRCIKIEGDKLVDENGKEIKYIGKIKDASLNNNESIQQNKPITDYFDVFKIHVEKNYVVLTHPYIKGFSKRIDYNTFMMIIMDNKLEPWNETQMQQVEKDFTTYAVTGAKKGLKIPFTNLGLYYSVGNLIFSFKELVKVAKSSFKEEDDFRAAELLCGIASHIPTWMPLIGDFSVEATAEREAKIWKRINAAKSRLKMADKGGAHAKVAAKIIEKEIFKPVLKGKELSYKKKLKAAGYLLYALEKGPGEYFRALANYAGTGMWVKALFGPAHHKKWLLKVQQLKEELKRDPNNEALRNKLVFAEMSYISEIPESTELYSSNFSSALDGGKMSVYDDSKVNEVLNGGRLKANYYLIYGEAKSYLLNARRANSIGALKALAETVDDDENYVDFHKVLLMFSLTGYVFTDLNTSLKGSYEQVCRTYAMPIGLYGSQLDGIGKILTILDTIIKLKNIKPGGKNTLTEYLYGVSDPFKVDPYSLTKKSTRGKIISKLESFWEEYGDEIVRVLDYRDPLLFNNKISSQLTDKEKEIIKEYFSKGVNDEADEDFAIDSNLYVSGAAPYYTYGVFNLGKKAFSRAGGFYDGQFSSGKLGKNVWKAIGKSLDRFKYDVAESDKIFDFVMSKYLLWIGGPYSKPDNKNVFIQALLSKDKDLLKYSIIDVIKNDYGHYYTKEIPYPVEQALEKLIDFIENTPEKFIVEFLKKEYSLSDIAMAIKDLEFVIGQNKVYKLMNKLGLDSKTIESISVQYDKKIEPMIEDFIIQRLQIKKGTAIYFKLKALIEKAVMNNEKVSFDFLASEQKNLVNEFIFYVKNMLKKAA